MLRLADLLAGLSRLADLGYGLQAGEALRSSALATLSARSLGHSDADVRAALYTSLLLNVGCTGYAHETAGVVGDELAWNRAVERTNLADPRDVLATFIPSVTRGRSLTDRVRITAFTLTRGRRFALDYATAACEVGRDAARRLALPADVSNGVFRVHEWWNGRGAPDGLAGRDIPLAARMAQVAATAALADSLGGPELAVATLRERSGTMLDPYLAEQVASRAGQLLGQIHHGDPRELVLRLEPPPVVTVPEVRLAHVARVFGDLADLKSPYLHGHAAGVAELAVDAGRRLELPAAALADLEVAALLHDVGRVAIPNTVWEKRGALTVHEREQVRLHAYHSERILSGSDRLTSVAAIVGAHHERLDGSGYHRGSTGAGQSMPCRVLAAADAFQAMTQRRAHRESMPAQQAAAELESEARAGLLDPEAVAAVLAAAGHRTTVRRARLPMGLTTREVEVLRLVARGCSNPEIARRLVVSRRTAEQHVQNIYRKLGVSSRAAAALLAMEHDLLVPEDP